MVVLTRTWYSTVRYRTVRYHETSPLLRQAQILSFDIANRKCCTELHFSKKGDQACFSSGLIINVPKWCLTPALVLRQPGFDVDMSKGKFRVPVNRWQALQSLPDSNLSSRGYRVQARKLASLAGTVISMRLAWGPVTQLYSRNIYVLVHSVPYLD